MKELELYIKSYFGVNQPDDISRISSLFHIQRLKKGEFLLEQGKRCDVLCFVHSGLLRIFARGDDREITQWISAQGAFTTDLSGFIFESPSRWSIQALTDSEVYVINRENYREIRISLPQWDQFEKLLIVKCFTTLEDRVFGHLSMSAEERYLHFFENNRELFNQVPLQYIASMLGMTPETFSRIRKKQIS